MLGAALAVPAVLLTGPRADAGDVRLTASAALAGSRTLARERVHTYVFTVRAHGGAARNVRLSLSAPAPLSWGRPPARCTAAERRLRCALGDVDRSRRLRVDVRVPRALRLARLPALTALVTAGNADRPSRLRIAPPPVGVPADVPPVPKVPAMPKAPDGPKAPPEPDSPAGPATTSPTPGPEKPRKSKDRPKGEQRPKAKTGEAPDVPAAPKKPKRTKKPEKPEKPSTEHRRPIPHTSPTSKAGREPSKKPSGLVPVPRHTAGTTPRTAPSKAPGGAPGRTPGAVPPPGAGQALPPMPPAAPAVAPPAGRLPMAGNGMTLISPTGLYGEKGTPWIVVFGMVLVAEVALLWLATCLALLRSRLVASMALRAARRTDGDHPG
ncbi:hypothetical protein GCM10022416_20250 [Actinomadura keratinilytica]|jgi:hypothetical protein|uniref:Uncharacterized protein n=2 Tax=Actinomadura keratinilytica TaxID=547461 RepID=A0ABP7YHY1_9ACTN